MSAEMQPQRRFVPRTQPASPCVRYALQRQISEHTARAEGPESVRRAVLWIECLAAAGEHERIALILAQVEAAAGPREVPCLELALHDEAIAEAEELKAEAAYHLCETEEAAKVVLRRSAFTSFKKQLRDMALRMRHAV